MSEDPDLAGQPDNVPDSGPSAASKGAGSGHLDPAAAARVAMTISCRDADALPRVAGAGEVVDRGGELVQVMHNGVVVEAGCYYGPWMTEIIRGLAGVHEPQEEVVFAALIDRLVATEPDTTMVELGSFWAYYSLWFLDRLPGARVVAMEPDPAYLDIGRRNFTLNGRSGTFVHGAVGANPGQPADFIAESTGERVDVVQHDLASLFAENEVERVGILMVDIQGFETVLLERALDLLAAGAVRFLVVSTHHHLISHDPLTHQRVREMLIGLGAHVIAEHSVTESYSGDGLVAVSFDDRDRDLTVSVSHARSVDSLFGESERELEVAFRDIERLRADVVKARARVRKLRRASEAATRELTALRASKVMRWTGGARRAYARYRSVQGARTESPRDRP